MTKPALKSTTATKGAGSHSAPVVQEIKAGANPSKPPRRLNWKPVLIVLAVLLLLGVGGGAGWWWWSHSPSSAAANTKSAAPAGTAKPIFMNLEPFTVNLTEEGGDHYLQMSVVYQVESEKTIESMKVYMPVIRNRILLLLSSKRPSDIATPEGKEKLVAELVDAVRQSMPGATPDHGVIGAFLGAFVVQ